MKGKRDGMKKGEREKGEEREIRGRGSDRRREARGRKKEGRREKEKRMNKDK